MNNNSLWSIENSDSYSYDELSGEKNFDVVIVGGGFAGLSIGYYLSSSGYEVSIIEEKRFGSCVSENSLGSVTSQSELKYFHWCKSLGPEPARRIAEANDSAITEISRICIEENIDCGFKYVHSYLFTNDKKKTNKLIDEHDTTLMFGIRTELLDQNIIPITFISALKFNNQAILNPLRFLQGLAKVVSKRKVKLYENSSVINIKNNKVLTNKGSIHAKHVVIASHIPNLINNITSKIKTYKQYNIKLNNVNCEDGLWSSLDGKGPFFIISDKIMLISGERYKASIDNNINHSQKLLDYAKSIFPDAQEVFKGKSQYLATKDSLPYIGKSSSDNNDLFVALGFDMWDITQSNIAGRIITDLINGKENQYAQLFDPGRHIKPWN